MAGFVLYKGPSQIDNKPIICICTTNSKNIKTGDMLQTWILRRDINPIQALNSDKDFSICGNCKLRKNICYVAVHQAPLQVYKAYLNNQYESPKNPIEFCKDKLVRLGSYGEPVAIPFNIWKDIIHISKGHTGYTHSWRVPKFQKFKEIVMASCDTEEEYAIAKSMGWRVFRVKESSKEVDKENLVVCPASEEGGKKTTCAKCLLCNGNSIGRKPCSNKDIVINVHGRQYKQNNFLDTVII